MGFTVTKNITNVDLHMINGEVINVDNAEDIANLFNYIDSIGYRWVHLKRSHVWVELNQIAYIAEFE